MRKTGILLSSAFLWVAVGCGDDDIGACGDGTVNKLEVCDDGNAVGGDGCSADCRSTESCGNGIVDKAVAEVCDDGNAVGGDGCSADCKSIEICGNKVVD